MAHASRFPIAVLVAVLVFLALVTFLRDHPVIGFVIALIVLLGTIVFPKSTSLRAVMAASPSSSTTSAALSKASRVTAAQQKEFGFQREGFGSEDLKGSVKPYFTHLFIVEGDSTKWKKKVDTPLFAALKNAITESPELAGGNVKLTACYYVGPAPSKADKRLIAQDTVMVFPDLVAYPNASNVGVHAIVDQHLVNKAPLSVGMGLPSKIFVFVCCHKARDNRCGVCGPQLLQKFLEECKALGMSDRVMLYGCSHVGGHVYAGNVLVFGRKRDCGQVVGDWYGYVSPSRCADILRAVSDNGKVGGIWRGEMSQDMPSSTTTAAKPRDASAKCATKADNGGCGEGCTCVGKPDQS